MEGAGVGKMRVYFTVDVECAEERLIGGRPQPPLGYDLRFWGRLRNVTEPLGLPLIVRTLGRWGLSATFFVEPLAARYFGRAGLTEACWFLRDSGHDVQLHLHPVQRAIGWRARGEAAPPSDDMADYDEEAQAALMRDGIDILVGCGVERASLLGFRAGGFAANEDTWRAMRKVGLVVSSNYNLNYLPTRCRLRRPTRANALFDTGLGVWELPISNFEENPGSFRHLQITAVSAPEMTHALFEAHRLGVTEVTIVTHSFEFQVIDNVEHRWGRPNPVNIDRLDRVCELLALRSDLFQVETVGALGRRLATPALQDEASVHLPMTVAQNGAATVVPCGRFGLRLERMVEQAYKWLSSRLVPPF